jgi:hypothetical protein
VNSALALKEMVKVKVVAVVHLRSRQALVGVLHATAVAGD